MTFRELTATLHDIARQISTAPPGCRVSLARSLDGDRITAPSRKSVATPTPPGETPGARHRS